MVGVPEKRDERKERKGRKKNFVTERNTLSAHLSVRCSNSIRNVWTSDKRTGRATNKYVYQRRRQCSLLLQYICEAKHGKLSRLDCALTVITDCREKEREFRVNDINPFISRKILLVADIVLKCTKTHSWRHWIKFLYPDSVNYEISRS